MASLRQRDNGDYSLILWWKGKQHIKALKTDDLKEANRKKKETEAQLARIRRGESPMASKLLADGHSILDVLFGSPAIAHLIKTPADDNPLTLSELRDAFLDHLRSMDRTPGHLEGSRIHLDHFIRVLGDERVVSLTDKDMAEFKRLREKEKAARTRRGTKPNHKSSKRGKKTTIGKRQVSHGTIRADFKSLNSAVKWAMERKPSLLTSCPFTTPTLGSSGSRWRPST